MNKIIEDKINEYKMELKEKIKYIDLRFYLVLGEYKGFLIGLLYSNTISIQEYDNYLKEIYELC